MSNIDRRDFLKLVGAGSLGTGAGFMLAESVKRPLEYLIPYVVPPEDFSPGIATWYNSVCSMCSAGCGISVRTREGRAKKIEGNASHPVSQGRLCAVGQAGLQVLYNPDRLTGPLLRNADRGSGSYIGTTWNEGIAAVADRLNELSGSNQGDRVWLLSKGVRGHLAGVFESFMGELESDHILHHDFQHPQTLYAANSRFFGETSLPYYDLRNTRMLLSFGADYLDTWLSPVHNSLGFGHSRQGEPGVRGRFVQIEPRMSVSGAAADEWIPVQPGTEGILALGLAHQIVAAGNYQGTDRAVWSEALDQYPADRVAELTGVSAATVKQLAETFAEAESGLAIGGGAAGNYSNGVDTLVAVNALNYLTGNVGRSGGLIFNPPPAIHQQSHERQASYQQMVQLADQARAGKVDVLILNNTNPVFTLPEAAGFREALAEIPLIVSLSSFMDESTAMADVILPSHTYLESWGDDFPEPGVGFPVGAVSQPVVSPLYNTRATGDIILDISRQLGFDEALPWADMKECIRQGWQILYERGEQDSGDFETFWNDILKAGAWGENTHRETEPFSPAKEIVAGIGVEPPQFDGSPDEYPFILHPYVSTGLRDGRNANLPWLQELPDPMTSVVYGSWVEVNPATAELLGLHEGDVVDVSSQFGSITAPVYIYPAILPDVIAIPIGQGHSDYGRYASGRGVNPIQILAPLTDAESGSLAWAATRVALVPTGERVRLVKTSGESRELGRDIIQSTGSDAADTHATFLDSIPITVEHT